MSIDGLPPFPYLITVLIAEAGRVELPLNVICLNAAMSVFARNGRWFEALELLTMMRDRARLRDVVGVDDQSGLLGEPPPPEDSSSSLRLPDPDVITYNAAIAGGVGGEGHGCLLCVAVALYVSLVRRV